MKNEYPNIFNPITIRGKTFKNRILAAPMIYGGTVFMPENQDRMYNMVENRARGGAAAVATGAIGVNFEEGVVNYSFTYFDPEVYEGKYFDGYKEYADRIKSHGALAFAELIHEGERADRTSYPVHPWGPRSYRRKDGEFVGALDEPMMEKICEDFRKMCGFFKACGFDGILVAGGHGNLIQQFISPYSNTRTDIYGGSIENRSRFPKRILESMRAGGGEDMIIAMRMSAEELGYPNGMTIDDVCGFAKEVDGCLDILEIMNGTKLEGWKMKGFTSAYDPEGTNIEHSAKIKAIMKNTYVAVNGAINDEKMAERVLGEGKADFCVLARALVADNEFVNKLEKGEPIRHCLRCFNCSTGEPEEETDLTFPERGFSPTATYGMINPTTKGNCSVNPGATRVENKRMATIPKKILIVGGGPAGMEAAIISKEHGNEPIICEMTDRLGGMLNTAKENTEKKNDYYFNKDLIRRLKKLEIPIQLNTEVNQEYILNSGADAVICAIGAKQIVPNKIIGIERAINVVDAFMHPEKIGKRIVIIGGGRAGCEIALQCAAEGKQVVILEKLCRMIPDMYCYPRAAILGNLRKRKVEMVLNMRCVEINDEGVVGIDHTGDPLLVTPATDIRTYEADTVIYAVGSEARTDKAKEIRNAAEISGIPYYEIGDVVRPARLVEAMDEAYECALKLIE